MKSKYGPSEVRSNLFLLVHVLVLAVVLNGCASTGLKPEKIDYGKKFQKRSARMTFSQGSSFELSLVPGSNIGFFTTNRYGNKDIFALDIVSRTTYEVAINSSDEYEPVVSPDGNLLVFVSKLDDPLGDLVYIDPKNLSLSSAEDNEFEIISSRMFHDSAPVFSQSGKYLYFLSRGVGERTKHVARLETSLIEEPKVERFKNMKCDEIAVRSDDEIICTYAGVLSLQRVASPKPDYQLGDEKFQISRPRFDPFSERITFLVRDYDSNGDGKVFVDDMAKAWSAKITGDSRKGQSSKDHGHATSMSLEDIQTEYFGGHDIHGIFSVESGYIISQKTDKSFDLFYEPDTKKRGRLTVDQARTAEELAFIAMGQALHTYDSGNFLKSALIYRSLISNLGLKSTDDSHSSKQLDSAEKEALSKRERLEAMMGASGPAESLLLARCVDKGWCTEGGSIDFRDRLRTGKNPWLEELLAIASAFRSGKGQPEVDTLKVLSEIAREFPVSIDFFVELMGRGMPLFLASFQKEEVFSLVSGVEESSELTSKDKSSVYFLRRLLIDKLRKNGEKLLALNEIRLLMRGDFHPYGAEQLALIFIETAQEAELSGLLLSELKLFYEHPSHDSVVKMKLGQIYASTALSMAELDIENRQIVAARKKIELAKRIDSSNVKSDKLLREISLEEPECNLSEDISADPSSLYVHALDCSYSLSGVVRSDVRILYKMKENLESAISLSPESAETYSLLGWTLTRIHFLGKRGERISVGSFKPKKIRRSESTESGEKDSGKEPGTISSNPSIGNDSALDRAEEKADTSSAHVTSIDAQQTKSSFDIEDELDSKSEQVPEENSDEDLEEDSEEEILEPNFFEKISQNMVEVFGQKSKTLLERAQFNFAASKVLSKGSAFMEQNAAVNLALSYYEAERYALAYALLLERLENEQLVPFKDIETEMTVKFLAARSAFMIGQFEFSGALYNVLASTALSYGFRQSTSRELVYFDLKDPFSLYMLGGLSYLEGRFHDKATASFLKASQVTPDSSPSFDRALVFAFYSMMNDESPSFRFPGEKIVAERLAIERAMTSLLGRRNIQDPLMKTLYLWSAKKSHYSQGKFSAYIRANQRLSDYLDSSKSSLETFGLSGGESLLTKMAMTVDELLLVGNQSSQKKTLSRLVSEIEAYVKVDNFDETLSDELILVAYAMISSYEKTDKTYYERERKTLDEILSNEDFEEKFYLSRLYIGRKNFDLDGFAKKTSSRLAADVVYLRKVDATSRVDVEQFASFSAKYDSSVFDGKLYWKRLLGEGRIQESFAVLESVDFSDYPEKERMSDLERFDQLSSAFLNQIETFEDYLRFEKLAVRFVVGDEKKYDSNFGNYIARNEDCVALPRGDKRVVLLSPDGMFGDSSTSDSEIRSGEEAPACEKLASPVLLTDIQRQTLSGLVDLEEVSIYPYLTFPKLQKQASAVKPTLVLNDVSLKGESPYRHVVVSRPVELSFLDFKKIKFIDPSGKIGNIDAEKEGQKESAGHSPRANTNPKSDTRAGVWVGQLVESLPVTGLSDVRRKFGRKNMVHFCGDIQSDSLLSPYFYIGISTIQIGRVFLTSEVCQNAENISAERKSASFYTADFIFNEDYDLDELYERAEELEEDDLSAALYAYQDLYFASLLDEDPDLAVEALELIVSVLIQLNRPKDAIEFQLLRKNFLEEDDSPKDLYSGAVNLAMRAKDWSLASRYLKEVEKLTEKDSPELLNSLRLKAVLNRSRKRYDDALASYKDLESQSRKFDRGTLVASARLAQANLQNLFLSSPDEAKKNYLSAIELYERVDNLSEKFSATVVYAAFLVKRGEYVEALKLLLDLKESAKEQSAEKKASYYQILANIYYQTGNFEKVNESLSETENAAKGISNLELRASVMLFHFNIKALTLVDALGVDAAMPFYEGGKLKIRPQSKEQESVILSNEGYMNRIAGRYPLAVKALLKSIQISTDLNAESALASDYRNLGLTYMANGDLSAAERYLKKAQKLSSKLGLLYNAAWTNLGLSELELLNARETLKKYASKAVVKSSVENEENETKKGDQTNLQEIDAQKLAKVHKKLFQSLENARLSSAKVLSPKISLSYKYLLWSFRDVINHALFEPYHGGAKSKKITTEIPNRQSLIDALGRHAKSYGLVSGKSHLRIDHTLRDIVEFLIADIETSNVNSRSVSSDVRLDLKNLLHMIAFRESLTSSSLGSEKSEARHDNNNVSKNDNKGTGKVAERLPVDADDKISQSNSVEPDGLSSPLYRRPSESFTVSPGHLFIRVFLGRSATYGLFLSSSGSGIVRLDVDRISLLRTRDFWMRLTELGASTALVVDDLARMILLPLEEQIELANLVKISVSPELFSLPYDEIFNARAFSKGKRHLLSNLWGAVDAHDFPEKVVMIKGKARSDKNDFISQEMSKIKKYFAGFGVLAVNASDAYFDNSYSHADYVHVAAHGQFLGSEKGYISDGGLVRWEDVSRLSARSKVVSYGVCDKSSSGSELLASLVKHKARSSSGHIVGTVMEPASDAAYAFSSMFHHLHLNKKMPVASAFRVAKNEVRREFGSAEASKFKHYYVHGDISSR